MTPAEFRTARTALGFTQKGLAVEWGMGEQGGRTVRRWEAGESPLNPIAAYCIALMLGMRMAAG